MRNKLLPVIVVGGMAMLAGCGSHNSPSTTAQTATVYLKDGTTFEGAVTQSDTSSVTVRAPGGETRSYPMSQVDSVKYAAGPPARPNTPFSPAAPVVSGNTPDGRTPPAPVVPEPMHTIRSGTRITVRTTGVIHADAAAIGQTFHAVIIGNVADSNGKVAIPNGSQAMLEVRAVKAQVDSPGRSELTLDLDSVTVDDRPYHLATDDMVDESKHGSGVNKRSTKVVEGPLRGTIVSTVPGGGKDTVTSPASGTPQAVVRGNSISIPAESILTFLLEARIEIQPE